VTATGPGTGDPAAADPSAAGSPTVPDDPATIADELVERFAIADRHGAVIRVRELLRAGVPDTAIGDAVAFAQREVGRRWQAGEWTITQEHAATAIAETVVAVLDDHLPTRAPIGRVAVVAAEGEWHALPVRLAGHACAHEGLETVFLGTGVPATDVARTLPALDVDALAVSVTVPSNLVGAARTIAAGRSASLPVLLGGWASSDHRAATLGADGYAATVSEGARTLRSWVEEGPPPPVSPSDLDHTLAAELRAERSRVTADAFGHVEDGWERLGSEGDEPGEIVLEDLGQLVDHLVAGLLLDDPGLFATEVRWLAELQAGRRQPAALVDLELEALEAALDEHGRAADLIRRAQPRRDR
jgi:MerR family transcriptional regulator, light-induced transcriptional regulator